MEINMKINNRGFTLIEIMVAAAMLGGLSLVLMQLNKESAKSSTKSSFDSDVLLTTNEINGLLSDPQKCLTALASTANPTNIDGKFIITSAGAPAQGYGNSGLKIANYTLTANGNNGVLAISYENKNILKGTSGPSSIVKNINLYVEGTPGAITKCRSLSTASADIWRRQTPGSGIYFNEGNVGIGTTPTANSLTVAGTIHTTSGGIKFPDGSIQASAPPTCTSATQALHWNGSAWSCDTLDFSSAIIAAITAAINGTATTAPAPTTPQAISCPTGKYLTGINASGGPICSDVGLLSHHTGTNPTCPTGKTIISKDWNALNGGRCSVPAGTQLLPTLCSYPSYPGCGGGNMSRCPGGNIYATSWNGITCVWY